MDAKKILSANFLDILFEGRNKDYGAYDLRKSYPKRLLTAIIVAASLAGFLLLMSFSLPALAGKGTKETGEVIELVNAKNEVIPPPPKPITPPPKVEVKKIQLDRFTPPKFVPEDQIEDKDKIKDPEEMVNVSDQNQVGERIEVPLPVPGGDDKGKVIEPPPAPGPQQAEDKIYSKVEISAKYSGNWKDFLEKNLAYPTDASENGQSGVVYIEFVVDREGNVSNLHVAENSPVKAPSLVAEAIRVIRKSSGKWNPGIQNDMKVPSYHQQPINFVLPDEG